MNPAPDDLRPLPAPDFSLDLTLDSGQTFHWHRAGPGYAGVIAATPVYVEQRGNVLFTYPAASLPSVARYFSLDHPLREIYATFPVDPAMSTALAACRGLRIIRQPLWECLATFITSVLKQVAHIAQISHELRARFGEPVGRIADHDLRAYPTIERIASLQEADLRACGLGFRARSLLETARTLADAGGESRLESFRSLDRPAALAALTAFRGVGAKVANCVLLFGYEHLDAFPIDVWIERVLRDAYFRHAPDTAMGKLQQFAETYFGPYGGYAQQYFFHHARTQGRPRRELNLPDTGKTTAPMRRVRKEK